MEKIKLKNLCDLPDAPCYAVIFSSQVLKMDAAYAETANRMLELASQQPGFPGVDSVREKKTGITVSYWRDEKSIQSWKLQIEHQQAQEQGQSSWYKEYSVRVARVERSYVFCQDDK